MQVSHQKKYYAGIGSREAPALIQGFFTKLAERLAGQGYVLRSGGAAGADKAFEKGCDEASGEKEIFLPWAGYNDSDSTLIVNCNLPHYFDLLLV